jgi:NADH-quinone oxidoreductase subunit E
MELKKVDRIIEKHGGEPGALIQILLDIQSQDRWLSRSVLERVAQRLKLPASRVQHVATFYKAFTVMPEGPHEVHVCNGTSCHLRGAQRVMDAVERVAAGSGQALSVKAVSCLGRCSAGPTIAVDGKDIGEVTPDKATEVLKKYA